MKTLVFVLFLCVLTYQDGVDQLQELDLTYFLWKLYDDDGFKTFLVFDPNTHKVILDSTKFITQWTLSPQHVLIFNGTKGSIVKFATAMQDYFGKWRLEGRLTNATVYGQAQGWKWYLEQLI